MDAEKQFSIQRQIRNNNEDFQSYARELKLWETEMKRKDRELTDQSMRKELPPIRKKSKNEGISQNEGKPQRISGYDYSSWDKFDVDKACEDLDKDAESDNEDEESDVEEEDLDRIATAVYNKEQGNKLVKEGQWGEAIEKYNEAIRTYPHDAVFFANRALCFLKMKNFVSAEADCTSSLKLDNTYVKAYLRRASARRALNQFAEARNDLLKVIGLEPNNKQAEIELEELSRKLNLPIRSSDSKASSTSTASTSQSNSKENSQTKECTSNLNVTKSLKPPDLSWVPSYDTSVYSVVPRHVIPPYQRSKKPLIKVNIEVDNVTTVSSTGLIEEGTRKIQLLDSLDALTTNGQLEIEEEEEEKIDPITKSEERKKKLAMLESAWNELQEANPYKKKEEEAVKTELTVISPPVEKKVTFVIPSPAKACSQFELHWRTLKPSEENLYLYLKQIDGRDLPSIFKEGLDTFTFIEIVNCLSGKFIENNDDIADYIQGLARTPRLASLVMFLSRSEKSVVAKLFEYCEDKNQLSPEDLLLLKETFEL